MKHIRGDQLSPSRRRSDVPVVALGPLETLEVELPSYLAAGYGWKLDAVPEQLVVIEHSTEHCDGDLIGGGNERFIVARRTGEGLVRVAFKLVSPFAKRAEKTLFLNID